MNAVSSDPGRGAVERAETLVELGRHAEASEELARVLASRPEDVYAWCVLSRARIGLRDHRAALETAERAASLAPELEWPRRLASIAHLGLGQPRLACEAALEAVRLAPGEWRTHVQFAEASMRAGRLDDAWAAASEAVALAPNEPQAHMIAGVVAHRAGSDRQAQEAYRRVLALDPDHSAAHHELARLDLRKSFFGNFTPARLARASGGFAAAIRANPRSEVSRRSLDAVLHLFLRLLAYVIFLDAWFSDLAFGGARSGPERLIPVVLLVVPAGFALRFVFGLPREVRSLLVSAAVRGRMAGASAVEGLAVVALLVSGFTQGGTRQAAAAVAIVASIGGRVLLYSARPA